MSGISPVELGLLKAAQIIELNAESNRLKVICFANSMEYEATYFGYSATSSISGFWNGLEEGDIVLGGIGHGNKFFILNKIGNLPIISGQLGQFDILDSSEGLKVDLKPGSWILRGKLRTNSNFEFMTLSMKPDEGVYLGNRPYSSINFDFPSDLDISALSAQTKQNYIFHSGGYSISGTVLRRKPESPISLFATPGEADKWYENLYTICLDPSQTKKNDNPGRNPALVESRNVLYEFSEDYNVEADSFEKRKQTTADTDESNRKAVSRRRRKNDTLSLSLVYPNQLIEHIEGTVVDAFGEIVDLNRHVLPIGKDDLVKIDGSEQSFIDTRAAYRKSLCFHWEMNARKDQTEVESIIQSGVGTEYGNTTDDYKRTRSRLFIDVDKEGQFKVNVPASSETGNVALLTRYENYSTINAEENAGKRNYDEMMDPKSGQQDILLDTFGFDSIDLAGNEKLIPVDRITTSKVKLGTAFHDIAKTCCDLRYETDDPDFYNKGPSIFAGPADNPVIENVASLSLNVDGETANAGGRSGTITLDGMLSLSIGANTADRQSLWLDLAGGSIMRFGRDLSNRSIVAQADGSVFLQIGGYTPGTDKRFKDKDNGLSSIYPYPSGVIEIRVIHSNTQYTRFVINETGCHIKSASDITIEANNNISISAGGDLFLNGEQIVKHGVDPNCETSYAALDVVNESRPNAGVMLPNAVSG